MEMARYVTARVSLLLAVLFATLLAPRQAAAVDWRFVCPNTQALISINWAHIQQTQAGAMLREKWLSLEALPPIPGIELLNDIDRVLISSPGDSAAEESTDPPVLVAIRGRFDPVKVRRLFTRMGAAPQLYNSFQVYRPPAKDAKDTAWVLLDARTILLGDARSIFAA
ncbi:MAG: hypothetical protein JOZ32_06060, partial [Bryobacterales bacterium]|nr:hypothetical protein [Bryobacterales bacterium]